MGRAIYCDGCKREVLQTVPKFAGRRFFNGENVEITITVTRPLARKDETQASFINSDICTYCLFGLVDGIDPRDKPAEEAA